MERFVKTSKVTCKPLKPKFDINFAVADLGFCSAEECKLTLARSSEQKKKNRSSTFTILFFFSTNLAFLLTHFFCNKTAVIEYVEVTVLFSSGESLSDCSI